MDISLNMLKDALRIERNESYDDARLNMYLTSAKQYMVSAIGFEPDNDERFQLAVIMLATIYYENPDLSKMRGMGKDSYRVFSINNIINQLRGDNPNEVG